MHVNMIIDHKEHCSKVLNIKSVQKSSGQKEFFFFFKFALVPGKRKV